LEPARGSGKDEPLLFCGDRKMASLDTRGRIAKANDLYLTVLPHIGKTAKLFDSWVDEALRDEDALLEVCREGAQGEQRERIARGYEFTRSVTTTIDGKKHTWSERVHVLQSLSLLDSQKALLEKRLRQAEAELRSLTLPGKGRRVWRQEKALRQEISTLMKSHRVEGLLQVQWQKKVTRKKRTGKSGR